MADVPMEKWLTVVQQRHRCLALSIQLVEVAGGQGKVGPDVIDVRPHSRGAFSSVFKQCDDIMIEYGLPSHGFHHNLWL